MNNRDFKHPLLVMIVATVSVGVIATLLHHNLQKEDYHHFMLVIMLAIISFQIADVKKEQ